MKNSFCIVYISKNAKKNNFLGKFFRIYVFYSRIFIFIMASDLSRRGRIFAVFWTSDAEKITIFWEFSLWEKKNCVFSAGLKLLLRIIQKKNVFFWEFFKIYVLLFFFFVVMFFYCVFWVIHDFRRIVRKNGFFSCLKNDIFSDEKERCFWLQRKAVGVDP